MNEIYSKMLDACYALFASLALLRMLHVLLLSRCALHMCVHTPQLGCTYVCSIEGTDRTLDCLHWDYLTILYFTHLDRHYLDTMI